VCTSRERNNSLMFDIPQCSRRILRRIFGFRMFVMAKIRHNPKLLHKFLREHSGMSNMVIIFLSELFRSCDVHTLESCGLIMMFI
jgi:hypothetical protein